MFSIVCSCPVGGGLRDSSSRFTRSSAAIWILAMENSEYALGHSDFELKRLARQAQLLEPATREYFHAAGMAPGMRVLDVGSGTGEVAFLAADFVGPSG